MRILLLTHHYDPETRPPQLRWSALVRDLVAAGHQVDVITPAPHYPLGRLLPGEDPDQVGRAHEGAHGETIHRTAFRPTNGTSISSLLDQLLVGAHTIVTAWRRRHQIAPDVVIATVPGLPTALVGLVLSVMLRRPVVLEMRDAWPELLDSLPPGRHRSGRLLLRRLVVTLVRWVMCALQRSADLVVSTTVSHADVLRARGVREVVTVRNAHHELGAALDPATGTPEVEIQEAGAPAQLRIVYAGTQGHAQGLETAVQALALTRQSGVDATLRIIGAGTRAGAIRELAAQLEVPVTFVAQIPRDQVVMHYAWADTVLVMLRAWPALEWTVPSKLYEALALGLHVSGSIAGEAAEIIAQTGAGFVVPPEDPEALAAAWVGLASAPQRPDPQRTSQWVTQNATEQLASSHYLAALTALVDKGVRVA